MDVKTITLASGATVPALGQGTWYLGDDPAARAREISALRTGVGAGMRLIDTAEMYGGGRSEKLVGEAIANPPGRSCSWCLRSCRRTPERSISSSAATPP